MCVFVSVVQCVCVPMYTSRVHGNSHTTTARRCPFCLPRRSPHPHPRAAPIFRVLIALWLRARPRGRAVAHPRDGTAHTRHTALQVRVLCAEDPRSYIARWSSVAIEMQMVFSFAVTFEHAHVSSDSRNRFGVLENLVACASLLPLYLVATSDGSVATRKLTTLPHIAREEWWC